MGMGGMTEGEERQGRGEEEREGKGATRHTNPSLLPVLLGIAINFISRLRHN